MKGVSVDVDRVSVQYAAVQALSDVSLSVHRSEFLALLGPSGCGKTTLLRTIAGFVNYEGRVLLDGQVVDHIPTHRRDVGMVFQDYALFPHRTVRENVLFGLAMHGVPRRERDRRAEAAIALLKLDGLGSRYPRELSGGQQQRVALARTLVLDPRVLLLDEPLAALDKKLREEMQVELRQLQQRLGITTIFVTHDQEEALALADRVAVMREGRIEQLARPAELYEWPANRFVADFIGRSNVLTAQVAGRSAGELVCRVAGDETVTVLSDVHVDVGRTILLAVRPEKMCLGPGGATTAVANVLRGTIAHVTYLGVLTQARVQLKSGEFIDVVEPNSGRTIEPRRSIGQEVTIAWQPADTIVLEH